MARIVYRRLAQSLVVSAFSLGVLLGDLAMTEGQGPPRQPAPSQSAPSQPAPRQPAPHQPTSREANPLGLADRPIFRSLLNQINPYNPRSDNSTPRSLRPFGSLLQSIAQEFLGAPYIAGLLDRSPQERLVVNLRQFDCLLLVETVLALGRSIRHAGPELTQPMRQGDRPAPLATKSTAATLAPEEQRKAAAFVANLEALRYRDGKRQDYCSRLHYFVDWIGDNQRRGLVRDLTSDLGGEPLVMSFNFMSQNRSLYPALRDNAAYTCMQRVEANLTQQPHWYLPTAAIRSQYNKLKSGDVVAVATRVRGLDVTHVGLLYRHQGQVGLLHAAPGAGVKISADLERYVSRVEDSIGIMVARPVEPR
jgi:hypothetical protein